MKTNPALSALRHHVTGAIARGEAQAITEVPAPTSAAHTPGPWALAIGPHRIEVHTTPALAYAFSLSDEANARLIAAAPELLAALEALCEDKYLADPINADRMRAARAAIAKARG